MQRRGHSGQLVKGQGTKRPKTRKAPIATASTDYSAEQFDRLRRERDEALKQLTESLEQQTASSEILASISGSMTDTKPVFDAIVRNLLRLFGARWACVQVGHDGIVHM